MEHQEFGEVMSIEGPLVRIRIPEQAGCASCGQHTLCFPSGKNRVLIARAQGSLKEGDGVMISTASAPSVISALLVFIGPILLGLAMWFLGNALTSRVWITGIMILVSIVAYFAALAVVDRRLRRSGWFLPRAAKCDNPDFNEKLMQK
jgi:positive regulator of sigma E activity